MLGALHVICIRLFDCLSYVLVYVLPITVNKDYYYSKSLNCLYILCEAIFDLIVV